MRKAIFRLTLAFIVLFFFSQVSVAAPLITEELIKNNNFSEVKKALEMGADVNVEFSRGRTPLIWAALFNHWKMAKVLIDNGAKINARIKGETALMKAAYGNSLEVAKLLIENGADINAINFIGETALIKAAYTNSLEVANLLIENGAEVNLKDFFGMTPLIWAAMFNFRKMAEMLIDNGAEVNAKIRSGHTALTYATVRNSLETAKLLIENGANVNAKFRCNLLLYIIHSDAAYEYFWEAKINQIVAEVSSAVKNREGMTALMWVALFNYPQMAELLIENGADLNTKNTIKETALALAKQRKHLGMILLLKRHGAH